MYSDFMGIKVSMNVILVTQRSKKNNNNNNNNNNNSNNNKANRTIQPPSALLFRMLKLKGCWDAGYCSSKEPEKTTKAEPSNFHPSVMELRSGQIRAAFWDVFLLKVWWFAGDLHDLAKKTRFENRWWVTVFSAETQQKQPAPTPQTFAISLDFLSAKPTSLPQILCRFPDKEAPNCSTCKTPDPTTPRPRVHSPNGLEMRWIFRVCPPKKSALLGLLIWWPMFYLLRIWWIQPMVIYNIINGLFFGPVVWIPRIPENERDCDW